MIELERFSVKRSLRQAGVVKSVVDQERECLEADQPGTARRFRDTRHAVWNIARIAASESMQAYIVKREGVAKGLATIIFGQKAEQLQTGQKVAGSDIDYWLVRSEPTRTHIDTVQSLILTADALEAQHNRQLEDVIRLNGGKCETTEREHTVFATEPRGTLFPRDGFGCVMNEVGPSYGTIRLTHDDKFGVARDGAPCQLYVANV